MFVALFGALSFGAFSAYDHLTVSAYERAIFENIEALTGNETGGITHEFCYEKGSSGSSAPKPQCKEGTTVSIGAPTYPTGTVYPCEADITRGLFSKVGYCYNTAK